MMSKPDVLACKLEIISMLISGGKYIFELYYVGLRKCFSTYTDEWRLCACLLIDEISLLMLIYYAKSNFLYGILFTEQPRLNY